MKKNIYLISFFLAFIMIAACAAIFEPGDIAGKVASSTSNSSSSKTPNLVIVSTLAGSGTSGSVDGQGTNASFDYPMGLVVDSSGNVYVADCNNNKIRKIDPNGNVTTFAGSGVVGTNNGLGNAATFTGPAGLAIDPVNNIYVAEAGTNDIRQILPNGTVNSYAGSTKPGTNNGYSYTSSYFYPSGIAFDPTSSGNYNFYIADFGNNEIRHITHTPGLYTSTLAGLPISGCVNSNGTNARFNSPISVAVDSSGYVYVADSANNRIRKITPSGDVTTFAGNGSAAYINGNGTNAAFNRPDGIAIDSSGNIYVADYYNNRIRKITPAGDVTTFAGSGLTWTKDGIGTNANICKPLSVAVDSSGNIYVGDISNNIRKITQ